MRGYYLYDEVTNSKGGRYVLTRRRSRPPTHTLTSLSRTYLLHTLPLTTSLALCRADRMMSSTSICLQHTLRNVRMARMSGPHTVREAAQLSALLSRSGFVRQHQRGAVEAMVPRLCVCVVPFVARAAPRPICAHT